MKILGEVRGGVVVMTNGDSLPEGTAVRVEPVGATDGAKPARAEGEPGEGLTLWDKLGDLAGTAEGLPSDLAHNHDHYLHGKPKR